MDAVVIAGGIPQPNDPLYAYSRGDAKALIDIAGKPMIQWVLDALSEAKTIDRVVLIGLTERAPVSCAKPVAYVSNQGKLLENLKAGTARVLELNPKAKYVLFVSSDVPTITGSMVDWVVNTCQRTKDDLYYNVIERQTMEARFPTSRRTYAKLRGMELCGGDINVVRAAIVRENSDFWSQLLEARKNPAAQAALIGPDIVFKYLFGQLTIEDVISRLAGKLGLKGRPILCPYPEIGMDVDKPHQVEIVRAYLARRTKPMSARTASSSKGTGPTAAHAPRQPGPPAAGKSGAARRSQASRGSTAHKRR